MSAEIGYWLGEAYWGRGVVTGGAARGHGGGVSAFRADAHLRAAVRRQHGSIRVLEKAGYTLEGRMPHSAIKDGVVRDQLMYGAYQAELGLLARARLAHGAQVGRVGGWGW